MRRLPRPNWLRHYSNLSRRSRGSRKTIFSLASHDIPRSSESSIIRLPITIFSNRRYEERRINKAVKAVRRCSPVGLEAFRLGRIAASVAARSAKPLRYFHVASGDVESPGTEPSRRGVASFPRGRVQFFSRTCLQVVLFFPRPAHIRLFFSRLCDPAEDGCVLRNIKPARCRSTKQFVPERMSGDRVSRQISLPINGCGRRPLSIFTRFRGQWR